MEKCLVIGSSVCDILLYINNLPKREEDIHIKTMKMSLGGCAFNVAYTLDRLHIPYTLISPVGKGTYGDFVRKELEKRHINNNIFLEEENGACYCLVEEDGERSFMSYHGVEYTFDPLWLDKLNLDEYTYIYFCGLEVEDIDGERLVDSLSRFKGKLIFAPGPRLDKIPEKLIEKIFGFKPLLHLSKNEFFKLSKTENFDDGLAYIYSKTKSEIIVTLSSEGSLYYDSTINFVPTEKCEVLDSVGAGDAHIASIIAALYKKKPLSEALDFANKVSAKVVGVSGVELEESQYQDLRKLL